MADIWMMLDVRYRGVWVMIRTSSRTSRGLHDCHSEAPDARCWEGGTAALPGTAALVAFLCVPAPCLDKQTVLHSKE